MRYTRASLTRTSPAGVNWHARVYAALLAPAAISMLTDASEAGVAGLSGRLETGTVGAFSMRRAGKERRLMIARSAAAPSVFGNVSGVCVQASESLPLLDAITATVRFEVGSCPAG